MKKLLTFILAITTSLTLCSCMGMFDYIESQNATASSEASDMLYKSEIADTSTESEDASASDEGTDSVVKHPLECPGTSWWSDQFSLFFSVSEDGTIENARTRNVNDVMVDVALSFGGDNNERFEVRSLADGGLLFCGTCEPHIRVFYMKRTDTYGVDFATQSPIFSMRIFDEDTDESGGGDNNGSSVSEAEIIKHPLECPGSFWVSDQGTLYFSVSENGTIENVQTMNVNGEMIDVALSFSGDNNDRFAVRSLADGELLFCGICECKRFTFSMLSTDVYNLDFNLLNYIAFTMRME